MYDVIIASSPMAVHVQSEMEVEAEQFSGKIFLTLFFTSTGILLPAFCFILWDKNAYKNDSPEEQDMLIDMLKNVTRYNNEFHEQSHVERHKRSWRYTRKEISELFDQYFKCIDKKNKADERHSGINAVLALEGQTVKMDCEICVRPDQDISRYDIEWQQLRIQDGVLSYVKPNDRIKINKKRMLIFKWVDVTDVGQYFCVRAADQEYEKIYQLDVLFKERRRVVTETDATKNLLSDFSLEDNNLKTFTLWSKWSNCNQCGKLGKRRKIGLCMVKKIDKNKPVSPIDIPIIKLYVDGIPCRSTALPKDIASIRRIKYRRSETIMGDCYIPCPTVPQQVYVTDSSGKVIEVVKPGYYSLKDKPTLPPIVIRKVVYEETKKHLVLKCPSRSERKNLVRWQRGTYIINPLTIRRQTRGRVFVDSVNRLHIKRLRLRDSAPYNCWMQKTHIATLKVIVIEAMNKNLQEYITLAGLGLTVFSVTIICCCVVCKTGKKKKVTR